MGESRDLEALQKRLGITFRDPVMLKRAVTHSSYLHENPAIEWGDNERLEFLGDAVADFIAAEYLYEQYPDWPEGQLTNLRALLVRTDALAQFARQIELGRYLLLGRGEELSGGRSRAAMLSDSFEALLGALYLDQGMEAARRFFLPFIQSALPALTGESSLRDAKTRLQEWVQSNYHVTPVYETVAETGPDHAKEFAVEASVNGQVWGTGKGRSKQAAEQAAAAAALAAIEAGSKPDA